MIDPIELEFIEDDPGFCQITYRSVINKRYYCLLWDHGDDQPPTLFTATNWEGFHEPDTAVKEKYWQYFIFPQGHEQHGTMLMSGVDDE